MLAYVKGKGLNDYNLHLSNTEEYNINSINNSNYTINKNSFNLIKKIKLKFRRLKKNDEIVNDNNFFSKYSCTGEDKLKKDELKKKTIVVTGVKKQNTIYDNDYCMVPNRKEEEPNDSRNGEKSTFIKPFISDEISQRINSNMFQMLKTEIIEKAKQEQQKKRENYIENEKTRKQEEATKETEERRKANNAFVERRDNNLFKMLKKEIVEKAKERQEEKKTQEVEEINMEKVKTNQMKNKQKIHIEKNQKEQPKEHNYASPQKNNEVKEKRFNLMNAFTKVSGSNKFRKEKDQNMKQGNVEKEKVNKKNSEENNSFKELLKNASSENLFSKLCDKEEKRQMKISEKEKNLLSNNKPGKRTIRIECVEDSLFNESFFWKLFENSNDLKKYNFLKDKNSYIKLFEAKDNKRAQGCTLKRSMRKINENEIRIFDENTYKNVFIIMKKMKISLDELYYILHNMKEHAIFKEEIEIIEGLLPSEKYIEELKNLRNETNWKDIEPNLRTIEKLLLPICSISRVKHRVRILKFYYTVGRVKNKLEELFQLYNEGCNELMNSIFLIQLFQGILTWVNYVNNGDIDNCKIKSVNISSLNALKSFKTNDFQYNALEYIIVNMISYNAFSCLDDITNLREILKKLQKVKGCEIIEEINYIETEINHVKEELNFRDEYKEVVVVLIKIIDRGNSIYAKLNKCMKETKSNIITLCSFYGIKEILTIKDLSKFPSSEYLFKTLFIFVDNIFNIMNKIVLNPSQMNTLLIDQNRKFGNFYNTKFYKNRVAAKHRGM